MRKLPIILQSERAECGLACLGMVLGYYGHQTTLNELRSKFHLSSNGMTMENIVDVAAESGLNTRPLKVEMEHLKDVRTPCILHWNMNHFVVLKKVSKNQFTVHDPSSGAKKYSYDEVSKHFTGIVLELRQSNSFTPKAKPPAFKLNQLWQNIVGLKRNIGKILALSIFIQLFALAVPYYLQAVIDKAIPTSDHTLLIVLAVAFLILLVFQQVTQMSRVYVITHLSSVFSSQVGASLFKHLIHLPAISIK